MVITRERKRDGRKADFRVQRNLLRNERKRNRSIPEETRHEFK